MIKEELIEDNNNAFNDVLGLFNEKEVKSLIFIGMDKEYKIVTIFNEHLNKNSIGKILIEQ